MGGSSDNSLVSTDWVSPALIASIEAHLQAHLKPSRLEHTRRVTEMAIVLANRFGVPYKLAKVASLLHDSAKYYDKQLVRETLVKQGIKDKLLYEITFLAHGELGAVLARDVFGIVHEDVLNAIRFHTYGRKGMSTLEKIVFIADYIEEGRDFEGVEIARAKALVDLDDTLLFSVSHSMQYLMKTGAVIHPNSLDVYNECIAAKRAQIK